MNAGWEIYGDYKGVFRGGKWKRKSLGVKFSESELPLFD